MNALLSITFSVAIIVLINGVGIFKFRLYRQTRTRLPFLWYCLKIPRCTMLSPPIWNSYVSALVRVDTQRTQILI